MLALFALGQHQALVAVQETLQPTKKLLAFLDDVYDASVPARIPLSRTRLEAREDLHQSGENSSVEQVWRDTP